LRKLAEGFSSYKNLPLSSSHPYWKQLLPRWDAWLLVEFFCSNSILCSSSILMLLQVMPMTDDAHSTAALLRLVSQAYVASATCGLAVFALLAACQVEDMLFTQPGHWLVH
jgi:hypothetical protein